MKLFSKASEYAIRTIMRATEKGSLSGFSPQHICRDAQVPEAFARKALQDMARANILKGTPGPRGGYRLARKLSQVSLLDIVLAVDGEDAFSECPMGLRCQAPMAEGGLRSCEDCNLPNPKCGLSHVCTMHNLWKRTRQLVIGSLQSTTLQDMRDQMERFSN